MIEHKLGGTNLLTLDYHYTADGLISSIDQSDASGSYTMSYSYDKRGRLIHAAGELPPVPVSEGGTGLATDVDLTHTYDQVGNRLSRVDAVAGLTTTYTYDVHEPSYLWTKNNRLLSSATAPTGGGPAVEKIWYTYTLGGHVKRILRTSDPDGDPETGVTPYALTCLDYNSDQQLCLIRGYALEADQFGVSTCQSNVFAREFRYDAGGRRRYWSRERDLDTLTPLDEFGGWREYAGESIYADLSATQDPGDPQAVLTTPERRYLHASDGRLIGWRNAAGDWQFVHADHLGSTRLVTGAGGVVGSRLNYAAFGEVVSQSNPGGAAARSRYGYCGGWGYEDDALENPAEPAYATGLLHVGARYYAPGLGRFVQRNPIGIGGGMNTYSYCFSNPGLLVDPSGHFTTVELVSVAKIAIKVIGIALVIGAVAEMACWIEDASGLGNLRDGQLYGGEDGSPNLEDTRAGGAANDQMSVICDGLEKAAKTPGTGLKPPGPGKPGKP